MEAELGGRFFKLFRGPMWSGAAQEKHKNPEWVCQLFDLDYIFLQDFLKAILYIGPVCRY